MQEAAQSAAAGGKAPSMGTDKMGEVSNMAVDAMSKEAKYEQLAEREELDREMNEEFETRKRLEEMKVKEECLERDKRSAERAGRGGL